jgi:hypothetical protein
LRLLHFNCQDAAFKSRPRWQQPCHRPRQADVATEGADLDHQFVAFLEQPDFTLGRKGQKNADFVNASSGNLWVTFGLSAEVD